MHKHKCTIFVVATLFATALNAQPAGLETDQQKLSYTLGVQTAKSFQANGIDVDVSAFTQAITDVLGGAELKLSVEQMQAAVESFRDKVIAERKAQAEQNQQAGDAYLAENKGKEGVVTLDSGLQYKVLKEGNGKSPNDTDTVVAHYEGRLIDGRVFDSSYKRGEPATFPLANVIRGWQEALPLMKEGAKWEVYIPAQLAYGDRAPKGSIITPNSTLIFAIELVEVK